MGLEPVNPFEVNVGFVVCDLIQDIQENKKRCGNAQSETDNVKQSIKFILQDISPGGDQVIFQHFPGVI
jgi:hypothetical protein